MGVASLFVIGQVRRSYREELLARGELLTQHLGRALAEPIFRDDYLAILQSISHGLRQVDVLEITVLDSAHRYIVASAHLSGAEVAFDLAKRGSPYESRDPGVGYYLMKGPIELEGDRLGEVHLRISPLRVERSVRRLELVIASTMVGGILFSLVSSGVLSRNLVRPIRALLAGVRTLAEGNFGLRIPVRSRDELGELTQAFNEMAQSLKEKELIKDAFRRYVPPQVASKVFADLEGWARALRGERRQVTILFADIRGFTSLVERLEPEAVVKLLNECFTHLTEVIFKHEGMVDKFVGDSIIALFGVPMAHPDDPLRAVNAAFDIQERLELINRAHGGVYPEIRMGIGITSGSVVVGNLGSEDRLEYTAVGQAVNRASRLQELAGPGEILISEEVLAAVEREVIATPYHPLEGTTRVGVYRIQRGKA